MPAYHKMPASRRCGLLNTMLSLGGKLHCARWDLKYVLKMRQFLHHGFENEKHFSKAARTRVHIMALTGFDASQPVIVVAPQKPALWLFISRMQLVCCQKLASSGRGNFQLVQVVSVYVVQSGWSSNDSVSFSFYRFLITVAFLCLIWHHTLHAAR